MDNQEPEIVLEELKEYKRALLEMESELDALRDVQANTEAQLHRYIQAVEQGPLAVVITDLSGNIEYVNPKFESITGYAAEEVIGKNTSMLQSGETATAMYQELWDTIQTGMEWKGVFHNRRKNGELYWIRSAISPVKDGGGSYSHYVAVQEDITLQRQAEKQIEQERLKFFHQSKMADIGLLAASILHEVGNPIASIHALIEDLIGKSTRGELVDEDMEHLNLVLGLTTRLMDITHEISDFTSPRPGNLELVDLNGVIRATSHMAQFDRRWLNINLSLDLDTDLPALHGYKDQLTHLVLNLLVNAVDAVHETGGSQMNVRVHTEFDGSSIRLSVADNGCGMTMDVRQHATEAFYTTKMPGHGTGLGLSLCQSIINGHNGRLDIHSFPENGTEMIIHFPINSGKDMT